MNSDINVQKKFTLQLCTVLLPLSGFRWLSDFGMEAYRPEKVLQHQVNF